MSKVETIEEFYKRKFEWLPESIRHDIGHFNVFRLEPFLGKNPQPIPYRRRDYYKIMLARGGVRMYYADQVIEVEKNALWFSNPFIPYKCEHLDDNPDGVFCVFNQNFFHQFGNLNQYSVFQPAGAHVFRLSEDETVRVQEIYDRMFAEINSGYVHKYDVLRNLVFELLHFAMKKEPPGNSDKQALNAAQRISSIFLELLERQFPIDELHQQLKFRSASDFASQLNVHVNHLNRAIKATTDKTTTQLIAERVLQESKILLKHSAWTVAEIAYSLGFNEATHFNNFFKKHTGISPLKFRKI